MSPYTPLCGVCRVTVYPTVWCGYVTVYLIVWCRLCHHIPSLCGGGIDYIRPMDVKLISATGRMLVSHP